MSKEHITQDRLFELFDYIDGKLYWKETGPGRRKDKLAGYYNKNGYRGVLVEGRRYYVHRLIFLYHYGYLPKVVDHINHIVDDNRIENLRGATHSKNSFNSISKGGTSIHKGVSYNERRGSWRARIVIDGKEQHIGCYKTEDEALQAYTQVAQELQGEFFNPNSSLPRQD